MSINKEALFKKGGYVGFVFYENVLTDINMELTTASIAPKTILNIDNLMYYLSILDLKYIKKYETKQFLKKIRINPSDIIVEDLVWESFIVSGNLKINNLQYWRPYNIISKTSDEITVECCETISSDKNTCYSNYDIRMIKKKFVIKKNSTEILLLKFPIYSLKYDSNETLNCSDSTKMCKVKYVYHGTPYKMIESAEYAPYNYYGNWFTLGKDRNKNKGGESVAYMSDQSNLTVMTSFLYEYKLKKNINALYFKDNNEIDYLFAHMMYFDVSVGIVDPNDRIIKIILDDKGD